MSDFEIRLPGEAQAMPAVDALCERFAASAVERDQHGGTPYAERTMLRDSGLLGMTIPQRYGGQGRPWRELLAVVHRLATVDPSIAHLFGFHHLMMATAQLYGSEAQWGPWFSRAIRDREFWGNAQNPLDRRTLAEFDAQGHAELNGRKSFCSGARDSDQLVVSAYAGARFVIGLVPTNRAGITVFEDWDNFGQRQTDSGNVTFQAVALRADEILDTPGPMSTPRSTLRACLAQLVLAHIYGGIAAGALHTARRYHDDKVDHAGYAYDACTMDSGAEHKGGEAHRNRLTGELWIAIESARLLNDRAACLFDLAWQRGDALHDKQRGELAVATAAGKIASARAALDVSTQMFELMGPRATHGALRLDRFWRNARTHTLHDPVDTKLMEVGAWVLRDQWPAPSFYG